MMDLFLTSKQLFTDKMLTDGLDWFGLLVDYCDVFISCLDSHSDGTHSLQRIHWWASDVMMNFSKSVMMKKQNHLHLDWPEGAWIFNKFSFLAELFLKLISFFFHNKIIFNTYTLKNKGASQCHRRTFFSKWFHKETLTSEESFTKGSLWRKKVLQIIKR